MNHEKSIGINMFLDIWMGLLLDEAITDTLINIDKLSVIGYWIVNNCGLDMEKANYGFLFGTWYISMVDLPQSSTFMLVYWRVQYPTKIGSWAIKHGCM